MRVVTEPIRLEAAPAVVQDEIAAVLRETYDLRTISKEISRFLEKTTSAVYKCPLEDGGAVVVKHSSFVTNSTALKKAYAISEELRNRGARLPRAYRTTNGSFIAQTTMGSVAVLAFADGKHFSSHEEEFASAGRALGEFHAAGARYLADHQDERLEISSAIPVEKPYEESRAMYSEIRAAFIDSHPCSVPEVCDFVREHIGVLDETAKFVDQSGVNSSALSSGILHNDFHTNNALYSEDGKLTAFLDIDQIGVGPHVWDIGNTLASFASNYINRGVIDGFDDKARLFLRDYHQAFPLQLGEYRQILAATQRWDLMRIMRSLRRHHHENNRLSELLPKIKDRLIPRIAAVPKIFSFLTSDWIRGNLS